MNMNAAGAGGFHLIDNVLDVRVQLPVALAPGVRLERATAQQVDWIREQLTAIGLGGLVGRHGWYECRWVALPNGSKTTPLPQDQWRYFVLTYDGIPQGQVAAMDMLRAANLTEPALASSCWFLTSDAYGAGERRSRGAYIGGGRHDLMPDPLEEVVDDAAVERWREAARLLSQLDRSRHEGIDRAVSLFQRLRHTQVADDFLVLGHFMVIEMLLTHRQGNKEVGDSLTHQVRTKIPLLSARMRKGIDHSGFPDAKSSKAVWEALYEYRSAIAHGRHADFSEKPLKVLRSPTDANRFLAHAIRRLLRYALEEPQLIDDLKAV